jgi:ABC-type uncharacterized transport system involved in gliding motility auxiliary subunit
MITRARKSWGAGALVALAVLFLAITILASYALRGVRLDLTQSKLYTIAPGTERILGSLEEPVNLYFFFSDSASPAAPALRAYAQRVRELLAELARRSDGKVKLTVIDPQPFSEDEDRATGFGLTAVPVGANGEQLYFGLAGTNSTDGREIIGFFQPDKEEFLEYDVASMVYRLAHPKKPVVGLLSGLPVDAQFDPMSGQMREGWASIQQMRELFDVRTVAPDATAIDADVGVLMVVHPKTLAPRTLYAIDQFVMRGGKLLAFVDPVAETDQGEGGPMGGFGADRGSDLGPLLAAWGVDYDRGKVVGDAGHAMSVSMRPGDPPVPHLAVLALDAASMTRDDVITGGLQVVNVMSAGALAARKGSEAAFEPLLRSSEQSALIGAERFMMLTDPSTLLDGFEPGGQSYTIAARIHGVLRSAYPTGSPDGPTAHPVAGRDAAAAALLSAPALKETKGPADVIVVADTDVLSDMLWIRRQSVFGQGFAVAWANNGDLLANALDNLAGSSDLISVRGRQSYFRPFTRVDDLRRSADERLRAKEQELDAELKDTEQKLTELEAARKDGGGGLVLTSEQQAELDRFQTQRLKIRKDLREVRRGLDVEIDRLGTVLKAINILLVPGLLALGAILIALVRRRRLRAGRAARDGEEAAA